LDLFAIELARLWLLGLPGMARLSVQTCFEAIVFGLQEDLDLQASAGSNWLPSIVFGLQEDLDLQASAGHFW